MKSALCYSQILEVEDWRRRRLLINHVHRKLNMADQQVITADFVIWSKSKSLKGIVLLLRIRPLTLLDIAFDRRWYD